MTAKWFAAFSFLLLAVHEAHELAHAVTARIVCGGWPVRDFNAWAAPCDSWLSTAAGPLFSYALLLIGALLPNRAAGVALLFAANPFARIFTAAMGGGDEMVVAQRLLGFSERTLSLRLLVLTFVTLVCGTAIVAGWQKMRDFPKRGVWFPVVLLWPMILTGVALFAIGNRLLRTGLLDQVGPGGAPLLVTMVSAAAAILAILTSRWLTSRPAIA
ncbi:MAG TPA: hypothetical protein VHW00_15620 [Thermoanaerobaculia bacterium]|nr:hypothetical protein [Thermoanaerobaculia bacterium]